MEYLETRGACVRKWTFADLRSAVASSRSLNQVCLKLGLKGMGSSQETIKYYIKKLDLDTTHWKPLSRAAVLSHTGTRATKGLAELLIKNETPKRGSLGILKKKLIEEKLLDYKCGLCQINSWLGEPLVLQLDHINGNSADDRLENLRLLCPNCHSQTETYAGKNSKLYLTQGVDDL